MTIDVIIPAYKPDARFAGLLKMLGRQTVKPDRVLIMNTEKEYWEKAPIKAEQLFYDLRMHGIMPELHHVSKEEFDHGGTRAAAAEMSMADVLLFMTQDAMPANEYLLEKLLNALTAQCDEGKIAAAYARQLPQKDCKTIERYTRRFNYGPDSCVKSPKDIETLGIKTFFCSNVCAAYLRSAYEEMGGFIRKTIFNEDMIMAGHLVKAGYCIAYAADAEVVHSHNYSGFQQFHRNFDLAVSQTDHPEVFEGIRSESEGIRLVKQTASYLLRSRKPHLIIKLIWQSGWKFLGYKFGRNYKKLPRWMVLKCSMNRKYWG